MHRITPWPLLPLLVFLPLTFSGGTQAAAAAARNEILDPTSPFQPCRHRDPRMNATYESFRGHDLVWQIPPNPRAVLFLAHGGWKSALTFFDFGPHCELCYGLPEDRRATLDALGAGYAVVALHSTRDAGWLAYPRSTSPDIATATALLTTWTKAHGLEGLPIVAWGHSSGGGFVLSLATSGDPPIRAVIDMNMAGSSLRGILSDADESFPPTMIVSMAGTSGAPPSPSKAAIDMTAGALVEKGVAVERIEVSPTPLSPHFLAERIHCVETEASERIYEVLRAEARLDEENYLVAVDDLDEVLRRSHALPYCATRDEICLAPDIVQELKSAAAVHTFTGKADVEIFAWLESVLSPIARESIVRVDEGHQSEEEASAKNIVF